MWELIAVVAPSHEAEDSQAGKGVVSAPTLQDWGVIRITVSSKEGQGTTVTILIPRPG